MSAGCADCGGGLRDIVTVPHDDGRADQDKQSHRDQQLGSATNTAPLFQRDPPQGAEDDNAGHVQGPT